MKGQQRKRQKRYGNLVIFLQTSCLLTTEAYVQYPTPMGEGRKYPLSTGPEYVYNSILFQKYIHIDWNGEQV